LKPNQVRSAKDPNRAVAQLLAQLLECCPVCRSGFSGHDYTLLATCVVPSESDDTLLGFFAAIKDHRWAKLRDSQAWLGKGDNLEAYAIRCSERLTLAVVKTHFELLQGARLLYCEALSIEEGDRLLGTFTDLQWHSF
jgi:hypothetical protein